MKRKPKPQKPPPKVYGEQIQFREPSYERQQQESLEVKRRRVQFLKDSYEMEFRIKLSRGW